MKTNKIIRKITSGLLICILALGITPKIILHNIIANHNDSCFDNHSIKGHQITKAGFNCNFENLVAESPFIQSSIAQQSILTLQFSIYTVYFGNNFFSNHHFFNELRGPPFQA